MPKPLRILVVEDSENDLELLLRELRRNGYAPNFERVETPEDMSAALDKRPWDIIISDYSLPNFGAPEALALMKSKNIDLPFIITSGSIGEDRAVAALQSGAHDFVIKGAMPRLGPAIERAIRDAEMRRSRKTAEEELHRYRDQLEETVRARTAELEEKNTRLAVEVQERRVAEEVIKRYEFIANSITDLISMVDRHGTYQAVNETWCKTLVRTREDAIGKTIGDIWSSGIFKDQIRPYLESCFEGRIVSYNSLQSLGIFGERLCNVMLYPYRNESGKTIQAVIVTRDITQEKQAETELIQARHAAEEANKAKSDFLANMSHEIRTPMNAIVGLSFLMRRTKLSLQQADYIAKIDASAQHLLHIINDILDFSKIEAGKIELEKIDFTLDEVLRSLGQVVSPQLSQKTLGFSIGAAPGIPRLIGDPLRLGQILMNLTANAIKFTEKGEVVVSVSIVDQTEHASRLRFSVRDTGIGLSDDQTKRLFAPFTQANTATTRRYGGTGLGLAISLRFVQMMGGAMEIQSKLGQGSTFSFTARFQHAKGARRPSSHSIRILAAGKRALVADPDDATRRATAELLQQLSFNVTAAKSGDDALTNVTRVRFEGLQKYDLVLVDSELSDPDCAQFAARIRRELEPATQPVVVAVLPPEKSGMSAFANNTDFDAILLKPFTRPALFEAILEALAKTPRRHSEPLPGPTASVRKNEILRDAKILLVDDNVVNRQVAEEVLTFAGCRVTPAADAAECLKILFDPARENFFHAVLMDLQMPHMDGYEATRRIRAQARFAKLPILAMTADSAEGVREKCLAVGMNDYLTKPIKMEELFATLALWVSSVRNAQDAP